MELLEEITTKSKQEVMPNKKNTYQATRNLNVGYKGLKLLEEKRYDGGTSIKYWM